MPPRSLAIYIPRLEAISHHYLCGVWRYLREHGGWELATQQGMPWLDWDTLQRFRGDGIIAVVYTQAEYHALRRRRRTACVNICARCETPALATVYSDNPAIGRLAAETLWETGVRRFAFVGRPDFVHDRVRGEGFRMELARRGADCETIEVQSLKDHPADSVDMKLIGRSLRELVRPVGIFAAHDQLGCQVLSACRKLAIEVPNEAAVLGVNDFHVLCETAQPPLSSIRQQAARTGYEAARLLTAIVEGRADPKTQILLPPGPVVRRRSTDMLAVGDPDVLEALEFVRQRFEDPITAADVAGHVAVSRRGLDKRFVAAVGQTVAAELLKVRLRHGMELLAQTELSTTAVSLRCGFSSISSFYRAFQNATGMTPSQYRKRSTNSGPHPNVLTSEDTA